MLEHLEEEVSHHQLLNSGITSPNTESSEGQLNCLILLISPGSRQPEILRRGAHMRVLAQRVLAQRAVTHLPHAARSVEALLTGTQEEAKSTEPFSR